MWAVAVVLSVAGGACYADDCDKLKAELQEELKLKAGVTEQRDLGEQFRREASAEARKAEAKAEESGKADDWAVFKSKISLIRTWGFSISALDSDIKRLEKTIALKQIELNVCEAVRGTPTATASPKPVAPESILSGPPIGTEVSLEPIELPIGAVATIKSNNPTLSGSATPSGGTACVTKDGKVVAPVKTPAAAPRGNMAATPAATSNCPPGSEPKKREAAVSPTSASLDQGLAPAHVVPIPPASTHVIPVPASVPAAAAHQPPLPSANVAPSSGYVPPQPPSYTGPATVNVPATHVHKPGKHKPGTVVGNPPKKHPPHIKTGTLTTTQQVKPKTVYSVASPGGRPASAYQKRR